MRKNNSIAPIELTSTVEELLNEYGDDVYDVMDKSIIKISNEARDDLRAVNKFSSKGNPSGAYSKSWDVKKEKVNRYSVERIVYNEAHYRLTHLLENGHALKRGGRTYGRVQAYPHIAPVNDKAQENLIKTIESEIKRI